MHKPERKYVFSWDNVFGGDMALARPLLGPTMRVEPYRLFQFALRDVLEQHYGSDVSDQLLREAGALAGKAFFEQYCAGIKDIGVLVKKLQEEFKKLGIGIFRVEEANMEDLSFTMTVDEDLDCSGLPDTADVICVYDEGFIQGILYAFSGKQFTVKEVDCWCMGARTCRFNAKVAD